MPDDVLSYRQINLAVRVFVDSVSHSSPLPMWTIPFEFHYDEIANAVHATGARILAGDEPVVAPFGLPVPYKANDIRTWLAPPLTGQILLHACAAKIAEEMAAESPPLGNVYTYQKRPGDAEFLTDQLNYWMAFEAETKERIGRHPFILQIDVKNYFGSVDRDQFFAFLRDRNAAEDGVGVLRRLLDGWMGPVGGLPLMNDSLFFMGDAYLGTVDAVVGRHTDNFIRFMDDYRIFGDSQAGLEEAYRNISRDLASIGFELNQQKVRLSSSAEYFESAFEIGHVGDPAAEAAWGEREANSLGPMLFLTVASPAHLVRLIEIMLGEDARFLTIRPGRLVVREIRKLRTNNAVESQVYDGYVAALAAKPEIRARVFELVRAYSVAGGEWQLVWLLFLIEDLVPPGAASEAERALVAGLAEETALNPVVPLWARRQLRVWDGHVPGNVFAHYDVDYLEQGRRLYGSE